jgi:predicted nucleotidyltransferase
MELNLVEKEKLKNLGVKALILFGSQAQGIANSNSDYDFYVVGNKNNETYEFLYDLLSNKINKQINIDIVFEEEATMELKNHLVKYGQVIYQENENVFPNLKAQIMTLYQDFAPYRQMFQSATLARIN